MKREKHTEPTNLRVDERLLKSPQNFFLPTFVFLIGVTFSHLSLAEKTSSCSVDSIPIQVVNEDGIQRPFIPEPYWVNGRMVRERPKLQPIQVIDGKIIRKDPKTTLASKSESRPKPDFLGFTKTVTAHIAMRLSQEKICINADKEDGSSLVQFVEWKEATKTKPIAEIPSLDIAGVSASCRVFSPWIDIVFDRKPTPHLQATIRWNERQFLTDQAILSGEKNIPKGIPKPMMSRQRSNFLNIYSDSEQYGKPTKKFIEEKIPPDFLWMLRHSGSWEWRTQNSTYMVVEKRAKSYTKIVTALIDQCFASKGKELRYGTILEMANLISLEPYRIKDYISDALPD